MLVLVCGGRIAVPRKAVAAVLDALSRTWPRTATVMHGDARGVDRHAGAWALDRGFYEDKVAVDPVLDGHKDDAPKRRNFRMRDRNPDVVIAFPGGPGTRHMFDITPASTILYDIELDNGNFIVYQIRIGAKADLVARGSFS